ncbi:hypothetical protein C2845_PM02G18350 [Panicum miliaceum]|uniref:FAR1 domain-containing protein n=1 Tax=Panicum miliaceum TaxID=4540 RepID=A0A3L6SGJ4_PANMI|nr:hypothetical protein C2845_PM02G18350 [Panicum miliaceum]
MPDLQSEEMLSAIGGDLLVPLHERAHSEQRIDVSTSNSNAGTTNADEQLMHSGDIVSGSPQQGEMEDCPCLHGNPFMHVMTELAEGDSEAASWKKRNRPPKGQTRTDCRVPKGMGPIEIALRNAPYRKTKYIFEPLLGITFDSEIEGYDFYNMYSWEVGFGIKKDTLITNKQGFKTRRDLRCLCSGSGEYAQYKTKKTGCKAMIRLMRSKDDG